MAHCPFAESGTVLGTAGYMAPEQVRGERADARTDLFATGCIVYEMVAGQRAFAGTTSIDSMHAILNLDPAPLGSIRPETSPHLETLVRHCLEKDPMQRFQSALDLAFALESMGDAVFGSPGQAANGQKPSRARQAITVAGMALAIGALAVYSTIHFLSPRVPAYQRLTFQRGFISHARFSPGGQSVVYTAAWRGLPRETFTVIPSHPESRSLGLVGSDLLSVSGTGELALRLINGTLARVPLAGGSPRELQELSGDADWRPGGEELAAIGGTDKKRLEYPIGTVLYTSPNEMTDVRVSQDGRRLAFIDHDIAGDTGGAIALVDRTGRKRTLTPWWDWIEGVAWAPSGREVWFTAASAGSSRALYAVTLQGHTRVVLRTPGGLTLRDIAPDGRVLLTRTDYRSEVYGSLPGDTREREFTRLDLSFCTDLAADGKALLIAEQGEGAGSGYTTYLARADGSPPVRLFDGLGLALSPDARWALCLTKGRKPPLTLQPIGAGSPRTMPAGPITIYDWANWFPDGRKIVIAGFERDGQSRCYVQDLEGGAPRAISGPGTRLYNPGAAISPDQKTLIVRHEGGKALLQSLSDGTAAPLPGVNPADVPIRWSLDGRSLFVFELGRGKVFRVESGTGRRQLWRVPMPVDSSGLRTYAPVLITADGRSYVYSMQRELSDLFVVDGLR